MTIFLIENNLTNRPVFQCRSVQIMSSDEEAVSPDLGASSSKDRPVSPMPAGASSSESSDEELEVAKKKRGHQKDTREWTLIARWATRDHEPEDIDHFLFTECKKLMEVTRLFRLSTCKQKPKDIFLWKHVNDWNVGKGSSQCQLFRCPLRNRFQCFCELKVTRSSADVVLEMRGTHDADSHAPDKDKSKFLKVAQIEAIRTGVRIAPKQSAKLLRRHLEHCSPNSRIDPALIGSLRRKVRKFRAELTSELLDGLKVDDSYQSLLKLVEERWFPTLLAQHNDPDSEFHFDLFEVFIMGKDLNPADDIVYMNMSSLWHILNWLRNIEAGWLTQLNGDTTFKINRRAVAAITLGVNSLGHVSNPLCWAIIPDTTEGQVVYTGTWHTLRDTIILVLKDYLVCGVDGCEACDCVESLRSSRRVQKFLTTAEYKSGGLIVDATLCDHQGGWHSFTVEEFGFDPNICNNHATGIGAANNTHRKYFVSQENYDKWYDRVVRMAKIGVDAIRDKADILMEGFMVKTLRDPRSYSWWSKTWSMASGSGRWSICHGMYGGYVTNAGTEVGHREDKQDCSPSSTLGEYLGSRFDTIKSMGKEHRLRLFQQGTPNRFTSIPKFDKAMWDRVQGMHPKTLVLTVLKSQTKDDKTPGLFTEMMEDIYSTGPADTPLHLKIVSWRRQQHRAGKKVDMQLSQLKTLYVPRQKLLRQIDPDNSLEVDEVRELLAPQLEVFTRLIMEEDESYRSMSLDELLDVNESYLVLSARAKTWSAVALACSCKTCYKFCVCGDTALLGMCFNDSLSVPLEYMQAEPGLRKARGRRGRGIAGEKRRLMLLKAIEKTQADGVKKSKLMNIKGPVVVDHPT